MLGKRVRTPEPSGRGIAGKKSKMTTVVSSSSSASELVIPTPYLNSPPLNPDSATLKNITNQNSSVPSIVSTADTDTTYPGNISTGRDHHIIPCSTI